jgi:hypothetical protein
MASSGSIADCSRMSYNESLCRGTLKGAPTQTKPFGFPSLKQQSAVVDGLARHQSRT